MAKRKTQTRKQKVATRGHINKPKKKVKKIMATQAGNEANNNLEQSPPTVNEDAQKDAAMLVSEEIKVSEAEELALAKEQAESEREALEPGSDTNEPEDHTAEAAEEDWKRDQIEPKPFDPKKLVANILREKDGA